MRQFFLNLFSKIYSYGKKVYWQQTYQSYRTKYKIGPLFHFNGSGSLLYGEGEIVLGNDSYIGYDCFLQAVEGCKIEIGHHCAISHNVKMYTSSYQTNQDFTTLERKKKEGSIKIGNGVWIGVNVFINPGINIGDNAVIGANSVVTMDIPAFAIASGVPAEVKKLKGI